MENDEKSERRRLRDQRILERSQLIPTITPIYCPFCGPGMSQTEVYFDWEGTKCWRVACGACGTHSGCSVKDPHPDDAVKRWNKRNYGKN